MVLWDIFDALSPHARVATAVLPFVAAMVLRVLVGRTMVTRYAVSFTTLWFLINVLLAPYSTGMTEDLLTLRGFFR